MRLNFLYTAIRLTLIDLVRNRFLLFLLFFVPGFFYLIAWVTNPDSPTAFRLASVEEEPVISVSQQDLGLVFIGLAAAGLIASFLALSLMQRNNNENKRLILARFKTQELIAAKFIITVCLISLVAIFIGLMGIILMDPGHFPGMTLGYILCGFVYGSYGMLVGSVLKRELEGILFIVLLANIDVGWLQNPIYYADAQNQLIIEYLPAFFPSQVAIASAFTDYSIRIATLGSLAYGLLFMLLSFLLFWINMRISKHAG